MRGLPALRRACGAVLMTELSLLLSLLLLLNNYSTHTHTLIIMHIMHTFLLHTSTEI